MASETSDIISFGKYLKRLRIEKGLDLNDIVFETRISMKVLRDIEAENFRELPNQTVLKGFLRTYADALGADRELVVKSYIAAVKSEGMSPPAGAKKRSVGLIVFALLACIAVVSYWMNQEGMGGKSSSRDIVDEDITGMPLRELNPEPVSGSEQKTPKIQRLAITTVEETKLKIIIDAQPPKEYLLAPGDQLELEASREFNILIYNAGGVNLKLNDKPVRVPGRSGQEVTMTLPEKK